MSNLEIFCWSAGGGFFAMVFFWLFMLGTDICRWAIAFIEDLDSETHRNILQKKFMSIWGFEWQPKEKVWITDSVPNCPHERQTIDRWTNSHREIYTASLWGNVLVFGFLGWMATMAFGICLILWEIALPVALFFLLVWVARCLRRQAKAKEVAVEKSETEKELEQRYPEKK